MKGRNGAQNAQFPFRIFSQDFRDFGSSQVGLLLIQYLNQMSSGVTGQNQIKLGTLMKQDEGNSKYFVVMATFSVRAFIN